MSKNKLSDEEYYITQQHGTEPPFSGKYLYNKENGIYKCVCCDIDLFSSNTKFESNSGWPSFYDMINDKAVGSTQDRSHGMVRTEVHCNTCKAHLGHVFTDGPKPTGLRYCINSLALKFKKNDK